LPGALNARGAQRTEVAADRYQERSFSTDARVRPNPKDACSNKWARFMIKFWLAKAAECRRNTKQATDPSQQRSWLEIEGRWFFLARSMTTSLGDDYYDAARRRRS
jgi:hypothetical protein